MNDLDLVGVAVDDPFAATRMSLGDHIEELRKHLLRALLGFGVALIAGFFLSPTVLNFIAAPIDRALLAFHQRRLERLERQLAAGDPPLLGANQPREVEIQLRLRDIAELLRLPAVQVPEGWVPLPARVRPLEWELRTAEAALLVSRPPTLTSLTITEPFTVWFQVSLYCGAVLASPWIFYQLWMFVAAGLYAHEKRLVHLFTPVSAGLFLAGVGLCQFVVLPTTVTYLLSYNESLDVEPALRLGDWLRFALLLPLVFGVAFQTPLVMLFLERVGLFGVDTYRHNRRLALFLLAVLAAVISVTPDYFTMLALAAPLWGLYEVGILLCCWAPRSSSPSPA
jgi:sec-independent protein translocase protein TatC